MAARRQQATQATAGRRAVRQAAGGGGGGGPTDIDSLLSLDGVDANTGLVDDAPGNLLGGGDDDILAPRGEEQAQDLTPEELADQSAQDLLDDPAPQQRRQAPQRQQQQQQQPQRRQQQQQSDPNDPLAGILDDPADPAEQQQQQPTQADQILRHLMSDPMVASVVRMRAQNQNFSILGPDGKPLGGAPAPQQQAEEEPDFTTMGQDEIAAYVLKKAEAIASAKVGDVEQRLTQRISAQENAAAQAKFKDEFDQVREKFPDVTEHKAGIGRAFDRYAGAGMTPVEMFALSVGLQALRERRNPNQQRALESERPTVTSARPPKTVTRQRPIPPNGPQGMRAIMDEALSDFSLKRAMDEVLGR